MSVQHEKSELLRGAGVVGIYTALSRVLGFVRDAVLAYYFGAKDLMDVFVVAFRIPNTFRRLFAEGSLTIAFVPVFTETLKKDSKQKAKELFDTIFTFASLVLLVFTLLGIFGAPFLVRLFAEGFYSDPDKFALAVRCSRIVFPYILLISLVAAAMGVLNSLKHFTAPAASTMLLNLAIILGVVLLPVATDYPRLICACIGVVIGGLLQLSLQLPFLKAKGYFPTFRLNLGDPRVRKVLKLTLPSLLGSGVYQISIIMITRFASQIPGGGANSYLYYADRVVELPLAIFGIAVATSALPALSRLAADQDREGFAQTFAFAMRSVFFIVFPAAAGLIALRLGITQILFQAGNFTWQHTVETSRALFFFSCGLAALAGVRITVAAFNAHQDTATPVKMAMVALLCTMILGYVLMGPMGHRGLALAVALSNTVNFFGLITLLKLKFGPLGGKKILAAVFRLGTLSIVMGLSIGYLADFVAWDEGGRTIVKTFDLFGLIALGIAIYLGGAYLFRFPEFQEFFKRRWKKVIPPAIGPVNGSGSSPF